MEVITDQNTNKGPLIDPAICRCCRSIKKCRLLSVEYEWMGKKEVYSDMLMDCFGLVLSYLDGGDKESCICATCITRLREAFTFKRQVLQYEEIFLSLKLEVQKEDEEPNVEVKMERQSDDDSPNYDDHLDADFQNDTDDSKDGLAAPKAKKSPTKRGRKKKVKDAVDEEVDVMKKQLLNDMKKIKSKIKRQTNEVAPSIAKKKKEVDPEYMAYHNTVVIVKNSYVCPFQNRVSNYYCFYCKDQFTDPNELREHTLSHNTDDFTSMMENKKPPKIDITRIDCRLCSQKIDSLDEFKNHISSVHNKMVYDVKNEFLKFKLTLDNMACTECGSTFPYFDLLKKHMTDHFGTFICDSCGACFLEPNSLATHIRSHKKTVNTLFPCEICGKNLKTKYSRYLHIATVHEKKPTVNCYKCGESFLSYALRNRHLIEVHGDKRTFPCKLCDKVYNRRKTLMEHNRRNHLKVYRHQCDLCEQKFYLPSRLKEHMVTHTGERNFKCEVCKKSYPRLKSLKEHVRTHTNERRYQCNICGTAFTQNASLKSHIKSHHQGYPTDTGFN